MSKPTLTAHFISQNYKLEGEQDIAERVADSAGVVAYPAVAASGAATSAIIRLAR